MATYDVWFNLTHPSNIVVEANSKEEAKDIAEDLLADMDRDELLERIQNAIDYMGVQITDIEEIE